MQHKTHSIDGIKLTSKEHAGRLTGLTIESDQHAYALTAEEISPGRWRYVSQKDGKTLTSGQGSLGAMMEHIPESLINPDGSKQPVALIVLQHFDMQGKMEDRALGKVFERADAAMAEISQRFAPFVAVSCVRALAEQHGYRLEPDQAMIGRLGECQAYHELNSAAFDAILASRGDPQTILDILHQHRADMAGGD